MERAVAETGTSRAHRTVLPVGRALRLLVGAWLIFVVAINAGGAGSRLALGIGATFAALLLFSVALHLLLGRRRFHPWLGAFVAVAPVMLLYFLGGDPVKLGVFGFFGVSLLVASLRGDPGCEVTSISTLLFHRPVHLPCLVFSPLDRLEESLRRRFGSSR